MESTDSEVRGLPRPTFLILGGFGNVLFQILAVKRLNAKVNPVLTQSNMLTLILGWKIHEKLYENLTFIEYDDGNRFGQIKNTFLLLLSRLLKINIHRARWFDKSRESEILTSSVSVYSGYFQSKLFLSNSLSEIEELSLQLKKIVHPIDSGVVLHFRWGDSTWAKEYSDYYLVILDELARSRESFMVVTDDYSRWISFIGGRDLNFTYTSLTAWDSFRFLSGATKLYVAPSTFSWWAAHLLSEKDTVILPTSLNSNLGYYGRAKTRVI